MDILLRSKNDWQSWVSIEDYVDIKCLKFYGMCLRYDQKEFKEHTSTLYLDKEACENLIQALSQLKFD